MRADILLVERGLAGSRQSARRLILAGAARTGSRPITRASRLLEADAQLEVIEGERFVSRGGLKLQAALDRWNIDLAGRHCLDVGASTGGFSDCMLQAGAAAVLAVDVGHGQLHAALLADPRVTLWEGMNARALPDLGRTVTFVAADLSFISLTIVLPALAARLQPDTEAVLLVKPQFEVGRGRLPHAGVVRDAGTRERAVAKVVEHARSAGWTIVDFMPCPVTGGDGNIEYLAWMRTPGVPEC